MHGGNALGAGAAVGRAVGRHTLGVHHPLAFTAHRDVTTSARPATIFAANDHGSGQKSTMQGMAKGQMEARAWVHAGPRPSQVRPYICLSIPDDCTWMHESPVPFPNLYILRSVPNLYLSDDG